MGLWDSFIGGTTDFIGGMPFGGGGGSFAPTMTPSLSTDLMQGNLAGTPGFGLGPSQPNFQTSLQTSAYTTPSLTSGGSLFGDTMSNLWDGMRGEQFTNLLNTGGKLWSISNQSKALEGMKQALEQQQQMAQDAYNRYIAEQEKRQQLNF